MNWKLLLILLLATALRFFALGSNPPGLYWDEVSLGYNAYSILKTGRDEHNRFLPIDTFKAFGDYKPPGYIYATVPSVAIFGLNNFAVRFPSALAGTLLVLVAYYLVIELFGNKKTALLSALLVSISPWSLQLSRVAFESNLATLFNALAILFFLKSRRHPWFLILATSYWLLAFYTFNANRLLSILLVAFLSVVYWRHLWFHKKQTIVAAIVGLLLVSPLIPHLRSSEGKLRWNEVNIFADLDVIIDSNRRIAADGGGRLAKIIHHRYLGHARNFLRHYTDHFNGRYLFLKGDVNPRFSIQDVGQLYLIELPFLLIGMYYLLTQEKNRQSALTIISWMLLAPIPASMARETPHALRSLSILPTPQIIVALGFGYFLGQLKIRSIRSIFIIVSCFLFLASFLYFQAIYYHYYPKEYTGEWLTSYPKLVDYLHRSPAAEKAQTITVVPDLGRPYIYFLFYNQYDPQKYAKEVDRTGDAFGFFNVHGFDKYRFERVNPVQIKPGNIYVVRASENPDGFQKLTTITETNGYPQFNVLLKQ